jgi:hypothetical protein
MSEDEKQRKTTRKVGYIPDPSDTEESSVDWPPTYGDVDGSDSGDADWGESDSEEPGEYDEGSADLGNSA